MGFFCFVFLTGPPPTAAPRVNNNIQSNFKRQNTVDTATIKENTPRYSGSRPATATAASTKTPSSSGKLKIEFFSKNFYYFFRENTTKLETLSYDRIGLRILELLYGLDKIYFHFPLIIYLIKISVQGYYSFFAKLLTF